MLNNMLRGGHRDGPIPTLYVADCPQRVLRRTLQVRLVQSLLSAVSDYSPAIADACPGSYAMYFT